MGDVDARCARDIGADRSLIAILITRVIHSRTQRSIAFGGDQRS